MGEGDRDNLPQGKRYDEQEGPELARCVPLSDYKSLRGPAILLPQALAIVLRSLGFEVEGRFYVLHFGLDLIFFAGTVEQGDDTERLAATSMDISLPLSGVCIDNHG
jgi:hypothetical protein